MIKQKPKDTAAARKLLAEIDAILDYAKKAGNSLPVVRLTTSDLKKIGVSSGYYYNGTKLVGERDNG